MTETSTLDTVRTFNRTVAERVGALSDRYLSMDRPLGEARVLWEIGDDGCEVRTLRSRLSLDSGYLSRLLRSLEAAGLVTVAPSANDGRQRRASLTASGRAELAVLDERSDSLARSMVEPLDPGQRERLEAAMAAVTQLLTAAAVQLGVLDPDDPQARYCLGEYYAEIDRRFAFGFDPAAALPTDPDSMRSPRGLFVVATLRSEPVGCGALKFHPGGVAEVKRLWVSSAVRGVGLGRRLLLDLERRAREHGSQTLRLDTNASLTEAVALYRKVGYREVPPYNAEPYADFWFEKQLGGTPTA